VNYGSYISPQWPLFRAKHVGDGYYCTKPDGPGRPLYNQYENNGNQPSNSKFQYVNSLAYRFVSTVQEDSAWDMPVTKDYQKYVANSMRLPERCLPIQAVNREPQQIEIWDTKK
jgi:hypothetical protein